LLVAVIVVSALLAVVVPWVHRSYRDSQVRECSSTLTVLIKAQYNYGCNRCSRRKEWHFHHGSGGQWWKDLYQIGEIDDPSLLWCRCQAQGPDGQTNFRGPAGDANGGNAGSFVGADQPDNHLPHEPLNAVKKSGDVVPIERGSAEFDRAMNETAP
jgi:type II secretory pathway pseudopilin PulG